MRDAKFRRYMLEPAPEFAVAAHYLERAADAMLAGGMGVAAATLVLADIPQLMVHTIQVVGPINMPVHRNRTLPRVLPKELRTPGRMPPAKAQDAIFERDKWCCRFCGVRVICKKARSVFTRAFPAEAHWGGKEYAQHTALYALESSVDHVVPHSRGGNNDESNLVTSCYCCQRGRGQWTLEEVELLDPREFAVTDTGWDGLARLRVLAKG